MDKKKIKFTHIALAIVPIGITPALVYILAEGWLDFGGGEKDIILAIPYFLWAVIFFIASIVLIIKHWPLRQWVSMSTAISIAMMLFLAIVTYFTSWLGVT